MLEGWACVPMQRAIPPLGSRRSPGGACRRCRPVRRRPRRCWSLPTTARSRKRFSRRPVMPWWYGPRRAAPSGPARVIRSEMPWIASRSVDLAEPLPSAAPLLLAEAAAYDADVVVAHRGAHRWAPTAEPVRLEQGGSPPLRERGVYLIAGGLGG